MLQHFTWQQFLIAALILSLVWYIAIILLFYRKSLSNFLRGKHNEEASIERLPHAWEKELEEEDSDDLMGKQVISEGLHTASMSDFSFTPKEDSAKEQQVGLMADALQELKSIFNILQNEDGNKADFFSLLKLTKAKYPKIGSNPNIHYVNEYIRDHVPFLLTKEELEDLWD